MLRCGLSPRVCRALAVLAAITLLASLPACRSTGGFDASFGAVVKPYRFSVSRWEAQELFKRPARQTPGGAQSKAADAAGTPVDEYMQLVDDIRRAERTPASTSPGGAAAPSGPPDLQPLQQRKAALAPQVEQILGSQIRQALQAEGIYGPTDRLVRLRIAFPPLYFRLQRPPHTLIVSPRERIESMLEEMLLQELSPEAVEQIERQVDALGVSALVEEIGGFGATYPTFVSDDASLHWIIKTATEEWLHQYLAFTPLGFAYILDLTGIARNYEIATINETVAGLVSAEVAMSVMRAHYPENLRPRPVETPAAPGIDFDRTMREIRLAVDDMLARGQVDQAERFMEERRQYLAANGYYIRRLNQAYFAFYGSYADMPSSVSPIGEELRRLRSSSASLSGFLNAAAGIRTRGHLQALLATR
jgi:hypothetical protein